MAMDSKNAENNKSPDKTLNVNGGDLNGTNVIKNSLNLAKDYDNMKDVKLEKEHDSKKTEKNNEVSKEGLTQKLRRIISQITVEPILACFVMPSVLSALATQNLYLEKACRVNLQYDHHICDALTRRETANYTLEEEAVQKIAATVAGWKTVLQSFLPCFIVIFIGAYSDRVGQRKMCMLLPIVGEFLSSVGLMVNTYFFYELPVEVAGVTEAIFPALTGGWFTMFMGVFSYIADITTEEERTMRMGIVNLSFSLGFPVGAALSGVLLRKIGLYGVFSISASLYIVSFIYCVIRIKEVKKTDPSVKPPANCCQWLRTFFDTRIVKETAMVAFKKGPNNRRMRAILLIIVLCVLIGPTFGELAVMYLFTRYRFNWDEVDYSMYSTYAMCTSLIGTSFAVGVFSHLLKFDDAIVGVISSTSKILAGFMFAFSSKTWHIYIAPLIEMFSGTAFIAQRSMVSKLVEKDELGKVNSIFGVAEALMPLIYAPMYTTVYAATIKTFPGAFFLVGGGLTVPAVVIFMWLYLSNKKYVKANMELEAQKKTNETADKLGIENKAYEVDENDKNTQKPKAAVENDSILQSQN